MNDFFPDIHYKNNISKNMIYEIYDSTYLSNIIFENNIPFLKETTNDNMNNIKIDLCLLKINNSDIKYNQSFFEEHFTVIKYNGILFSFIFFIIFLLFLNIISYFRDVKRKQKRACPKKDKPVESCLTTFLRTYSPPGRIALQSDRSYISLITVRYRRSLLMTQEPRPGGPLSVRSSEVMFPCKPVPGSHLPGLSETFYYSDN